MSKIIDAKLIDAKLIDAKLIDVIIEIPYNTYVKYEIDEKSNKMRCDRILQYNITTSNEINKQTGEIVHHRAINPKFTYPGNYGYIPNTLAGDGDPLDILLISDYKLDPDVIIETKIIGVLIMDDEKGRDDKIIVVPSSNVDQHYNKINEINDLPAFKINNITQFFKHYKDEDKNRWSKVIGFGDSKKACEILEKAQLAVIHSQLPMYKLS